MIWLQKTEEKIDVRLDVRNLMCPRPVLRAYQTLKKMEPGNVLEIIATARLTQYNIPYMVRMSGNELLAQEKTDTKEFRFLVKKLNAN